MNENQSKINYFHRVFLGWLESKITTGRVSASRSISDMAPIDLKQNRDLFDRFLQEHNEEENWRQLEAEHGRIKVLTYDNGDASHVL